MVLSRKEGENGGNICDCIFPVKRNQRIASSGCGAGENFLCCKGGRRLHLCPEQGLCVNIYLDIQTLVSYIITRMKQEVVVV